MGRQIGGSWMSVIPTDLVEAQYDPTAKPGESVEQIDVSLLDPNPHQPRHTFDRKELDALADSIKVHGVLQPVVLTKESKRYELIAGERRLRASKLAGLKTIPAIIRSFDEQHKLELALIENLQRAELNPIETATAYRKLADQFNLSLSQIGKRVGKDKSTVANMLRLLRLPAEAKEAVVEGQISEGHARVLLTLSPEKQQEALKLIKQNKWTVRQAEEFARGVRQSGDAAKGIERIAGFKGEDEISRNLSQLTGREIKIRPTAKGGRLMIYFSTDEELEQIAEALKKGWK